jgi:hypothetical protein
VTAAALARDAGGTQQPFGVDTYRCGVSLVPLDLPSIDVVRGLADDMHRALPDVVVCTTPSFALDPGAIDERRRQLDGHKVADRLARPLAAVVGSSPVMVLGVTNHDLYFTERPDLPYDADYLLFLDSGQAVDVISTARLGQGNAFRHRLDVLGMRAVGLGYFSIGYTNDDSALHFHLHGVESLDRLEPTLGDPPYDSEQLARYRQRFLDALSRR